MDENSVAQNCEPKPLIVMTRSLIGIVLAGFSCLFTVFTGLVVFRTGSMGMFLVVVGILVNLSAWSSYRPNKHTQSSNTLALLGFWICLIVLLIKIYLHCTGTLIEPLSF